jgi:hypothetical protein
MNYCNFCDKDIDKCSYCNKDILGQFICVAYSRTKDISPFHFCCIECKEEFMKEKMNTIIVSNK